MMDVSHRLHQVAQGPQCLAPEYSAFYARNLRLGPVYPMVTTSNLPLSFLEPDINQTAR